MPKPKVGVLIDHKGVTSVTMLADDPQGREEALALYNVIRAKVDVFDRQVRQLLAKRMTSQPGVAH